MSTHPAAYLTVRDPAALYFTVARSLILHVIGALGLLGVLWVKHRACVRPGEP